MEPRVIVVPPGLSGRELKNYMRGLEGKAPQRKRGRPAGWHARKAGAARARQVLQESGIRRKLRKQSTVRSEDARSGPDE